MECTAPSLDLRPASVPDVPTNAHVLAQDTALQAGERLHLHAARGAAFLVVEGRLRVTAAPQWLDGLAIAQERIVDAGQSYVADRGGWLFLRAEPGEGVRWRGLPSMPGSGASWLAALRRLRRWRGWYVGRGFWRRRGHV